MELVIIIWLFLGIIAAMIGAQKGEGIAAFIFGIFLGPLGILIALFSQGNRKRCPFCKELVHKDASVCPRCRSVLGPRSS